MIIVLTVSRYCVMGATTAFVEQNKYYGVSHLKVGDTRAVSAWDLALPTGVNKLSSLWWRIPRKCPFYATFVDM